MLSRVLGAWCFIRLKLIFAMGKTIVGIGGA